MSGTCCKCGNSPKDKNVVLVRTNPKGELAIWECSPACGVDFINKLSAIQHAIDLNNINGEEEVAVGKLRLT